jgi:hypothetical protein
MSAGRARCELRGRPDGACHDPAPPPADVRAWPIAVSGLEPWLRARHQLSTAEGGQPGRKDRRTHAPRPLGRPARLRELTAPSLRPPSAEAGSSRGPGPIPTAVGLLWSALRAAGQRRTGPGQPGIHCVLRASDPPRCAPAWPAAAIIPETSVTRISAGRYSPPACRISRFRPAPDACWPFEIERYPFSSRRPSSSPARPRPPPAVADKAWFSGHARQGDRRRQVEGKMSPVFPQRPDPRDDDDDAPRRRVVAASRTSASASTSMKRLWSRVPTLRPGDRLVNADAPRDRIDGVRSGCVPGRRRVVNDLGTINNSDASSSAARGRRRPLSSSSVSTGDPEGTG